MNTMSFPEIQASLDLYQEACGHRTPPEWYTRTSPAAVAEERESGKKFRKAVELVKLAVGSDAPETLGMLMATADVARRDAWGKHYARRLDIAVRRFDMLCGTPATRYAMFHNGVAKTMKAAEVAIGTAKIWQGEDAEDEFKGWRPLVIEAEDALRDAWDAFKRAEREVTVSNIFNSPLGKILASLVGTVQKLLALDESELKRMGLSPIQVAEIEAKIGSPRPQRPQYEDRRDQRGSRHTIADAVGPAKVTALNGAAAKSGALANLEAAYADLVKEGGRLYEVAVFFYDDPLRRADQRARNTADALRKAEAKGQKPAAKDLQEAVSAVQDLRRIWAETLTNPPSASWLVHAQLLGHFASTPKAQRPTYEAILAMGEAELQFTGKVGAALAQIGFAKKAVEIGLNLFEAATLTGMELLAKGLTEAEFTLIEERRGAPARKQAERAAPSPEAKVAAATDATTLDGAGNGHDGPAPAADEPLMLDDPKFKGFVVAEAERASQSAEGVLKNLAADPAALTAARAAYETFLAGGNGKDKPESPKRKAKADGKAAAEAKSNGTKPTPRRSRTREAAETVEE